MKQNDQEAQVRRIRARYVEAEHTRLDELKALDAKVRRPARVFSLVLGTVAALVMGAGMSLVMTDLGAWLGLSDPMLPGILIGTVGLVMAAVNYPIYKSVLRARRKHCADRVVALSDELLGG